ncbi:MAG: hypothetical protein KGH55_01565 [Nanoarchaeota archaeon]|nr:hypothetical protein [Nanoarchaeota archaeon]
MVKFEVEAISNLQNTTLRAGIIKDGMIEIHTPARVLNSAEFDNGKKIESKGLGISQFPHQVFEITKFMKPERLVEFSRNADISATILKQVKRISDAAGAGRLTIFHPVISRNPISDEINTKLIELQLASNIDLIAVIDEYGSSVPKFVNRLQSSIKRINDSEQYAEPMPMIRIDSDYNIFGEKIDAAINEGVKVINIVYAPIDKNFANYSYLINLTKNKGKKVWIHMSEVPRRLYKKIPAMHLLPLVGIDSYALNSRPFPMGLIKRKEVAVKRFDNISLRFLTLPEHIKLYGDNPKCNCFVENRQKLSEVLSVFQAAELLSPAIACHEAISSYYELQNFRRAIIQKRAREYLSGKENLIYPIKKLLKIDLAQQQL